MRKITELPYDSKNITNDIDYICKKLELSSEELEKILKLPVKSYKDYKTYDNFKKHLNPLIKYLKKINLWPTIA